jgi:CelD/BcsL family acetyltransferase involved in cellulose biosynthesis
VALGLSDYHGVVIQRETVWSARELVRQCGLGSYECDFLIAPQAPFLQYHTAVWKSRIIDLRDGYAQYCKDRTRLMAELRRDERQLVKDLGPVRMDVSALDPSGLRKLIQLKREQYARTGVPDPLEREPVRRFLERIHGTQGPNFAGTLTMLYAGDTLVAAHFGMRSREYWQGWFPAYVPSYARYSPGLLLWGRMCQTAGELGMRAVDLGYGDEPYKLRLANHSAPVVGGTVGTSWPAMSRRCLWCLKQRVRRTRLEEPARLIARRLRRIMRAGGKGVTTLAGEG